MTTVLRSDLIRFRPRGRGPQFLGDPRRLMRHGDRIGPGVAPSLWHHAGEPACACQYCAYRALVQLPETRQAFAGAALEVAQ